MHEVPIVKDIVKNLEEHYGDRFKEISKVKV
ncbi:hydrogenase maturation nickel metallochaperone HypA, partial [Escherichia coli]|nr:hydrogenase maturation nickel metallochaperone HypA [Escherichia coli]